MHKILIGFCLVIGFCFSSSATEFPASVYLLSDTIFIDQEKIEGDSNYTVLPLQEGICLIGDTLVDLSMFKTLDTTLEWKNLSYRPGIISFIKVDERFREGPGKNDSALLWGKTIRAKKPKRDMFYDAYRRESGFPNRCPPMQCSYFYLAQDKKHKLLEIRDPAGLKEVVVVNKPTDAFFLVNDRMFYSGRYAKTAAGFYILVNEVVTHCRIQYADLLYFVSNDGEVSERGRVVTWMTNLCY